jgi:hypothetical protein
MGVTLAAIGSAFSSTIFGASIFITVFVEDGITAAVPVRGPRRGVVLIPVKVCRRVAAVDATVPWATVGNRTAVATPIRAETRRVVGVTGVRCISGGRDGVTVAFIAGLVNVSTDFETIPFFSFLILMMEDLLQPEGPSSMTKMEGGFFALKNSVASIHCSSN